MQFARIAGPDSHGRCTSPPHPPHTCPEYFGLGIITVRKGGAFIVITSRDPVFDGTMGGSARKASPKPQPGNASWKEGGGEIREGGDRATALAALALGLLPLSQHSFGASCPQQPKPGPGSRGVPRTPAARCTPRRDARPRRQARGPGCIEPDPHLGRGGARREEDPDALEQVSLTLTPHVFLMQDCWALTQRICAYGGPRPGPGLLFALLTASNRSSSRPSDRGRGLSLCSPSAL